MLHLQGRVSWGCLLGNYLTVRASTPSLSLQGGMAGLEMLASLFYVVREVELLRLSHGD